MTVQLKVEIVKSNLIPWIPLFQFWWNLTGLCTLAKFQTLEDRNCFINGSTGGMMLIIGSQGVICGEDVLSFIIIHFII